MWVTRRRLLVSGAAAAAVAALGVPMVDLPGPGPGAFVLSEGEKGLVRAVGDAMFPPDNPVGICALDVDLGALVDDLVGDVLDPMVAPLFRYLLRALEVGTLASRGAPFSALSRDVRREVLTTWSDNAILPRRLAYDSFKTILGMAFFNAPEVRAAAGWESTLCHGGGR